MEKTRVGIIGCGGISHFHMDGYRHLEDLCEVVAACDIDEEKLKAYGEEFGITALYTDYNEMLKAEKLDAVSVTTWNAEHCNATIAALKAGCNVICEKPMAMNTEQALAMEKAAKESGKVLQIGFVRRYGGDCISARDFVESGKMGKVIYAKVEYLRRRGCPGGWFADTRYSGGGPLTDLGVHVMDLARYIAGKPKPVAAYGVVFQKAVEYENTEEDGNDKKDWTVTKSDGKFEVNVEDFATGYVRFDNGFVLNVSTSFNLNIPDGSNMVQIIGTKAGITIGDPSTYYLSDGTNGTMDNTNYPSCGFEDIFRAEIAHFIDCVRNGTECIAPAHDGVVLMQIIDAIYESARTGKEALVKNID